MHNVTNAILFFRLYHHNYKKMTSQSEPNLRATPKPMLQVKQILVTLKIECIKIGKQLLGK